MNIMNNTPPVVKNFIIINVLVFALTSVLDRMGINTVELLGLYFFKSDYFRPYQYVTYMFMHGGIFHIVFNMYALWLFGRALEQVWGGKRFFIFFIITGLGAALCHTAVLWYENHQIINAANAFINTPTPKLFSAFIQEYVPGRNNNIYNLLNSFSESPDNKYLISLCQSYINEIKTQLINIPTVGASGAVFGILLGFGMLFPNTELMLLFFPVPIKAKYFVIGYGAIELLMGVVGEKSNVAHFAHLGGMLFGFILIKYWTKYSKGFY